MGHGAMFARSLFNLLFFVVERHWHIWKGNIGALVMDNINNVFFFELRLFGLLHCSRMLFCLFY